MVHTLHEYDLIGTHIKKHGLSSLTRILETNITDKRNQVNKPVHEAPAAMGSGEGQMYATLPCKQREQILWFIFVFTDKGIHPVLGPT